MGLLVSCARSTPYEYTMQGIRVVHLNGLVDEFLPPIRVKEVLLSHPQHFICTSRDLQVLNARPLPPEEELRVSELYFLLPFTALQGGVSATDLMSLVSRLMAAAKKSASKFSANKGGITESSPMAPLMKTGKDDGVDIMNSNECFERLLMAKTGLPDAGNCIEFQKLISICDSRELQMAYRQHVISRSTSWRPRLGTIEESYFSY
eukprot:Gb_35305 [translate_table: standard]